MNSTHSIAIPSFQYSESSSVSVDAFELLCCIGQGAYGQVWLCQKRDSRVLYAMKIIAKTVLNKPVNLSRIVRERQLLASIDSPFVVKLRFCFQDATSIYLVTDYYSGGDLFSLVQAQPYNRLQESDAKCYLAEIVVALEHLHSVNVIYRDLKMENILLTNSGHIIITDLGMSKKAAPGERSYSIVGTPEFMSPEIISRKGHEMETDFWSLGILAYQLMVGVVPFSGDSVNSIFRHIVQRPVVLPPFLSPQACDFVHLLLQKDPAQRLGHRGIRDVMAHPFFLGVDWDAVHARALPLPLTAAAVHAREMEDEPPGRPVNEFDRFSHYVDGTDRYEQKQLVKRLIARWVQYDLAELDTAWRLADDVHGCLPFRGVGAADGAGYCTFSSKKELLASVANEKTLFPQIASYLAKLALRVDEDTMIFESDRCVCQWRAWGQNSVDAYVCIHGTITVNLNLDNTVRHLDIRTAVSPVLLFRSISQESVPLRASVQNAGDILRAILLSLGQDTPKLFDAMLRCSLVQTMQLFQIHVESDPVCVAPLMRLEQVVSILCDGMQDRSVLLARTPLLGPSPHAVDFVISGRHVAALFGLEPADDRAYVYGSLRLEEEGLGGRLRLDALTDVRAVEALLCVAKDDGDAVVNNMANLLQCEGEIEKACWMELFAALLKGDARSMLLALKQLAKQQYLRSSEDSIDSIYQDVTAKLGIADYAALREAEEATLRPTQQLQKGLCSLLVSFRIQEFLTHIIVSSK
ncbi:ribosomal protein S6 kinase alpha-3 [Blastocystis sp. ATCC 50177/Nand II]|uniref:Ribosomal protein S6 kinase alpha-3 n=1 Tax=Blastocystis sp. subtype 1 (strain ATCC 50177 / NandII) TaxID=478820 RepID=A0A196SE32_BLAHN|nr:ribosomal protein S6 kinase alpha-3 [Blastocystis sp. ATCC 50177/Nand II]